MKCTSRNLDSGFTLIEIIVATTILGLVLVVVLQIFSIGISSTRRSQRSALEVSVAQNLMEEVLSRDSVSDAFERGVMEEFNLEYTIDIQPGKYEGLHEVEVAVMWNGAGEKSTYKLFCYVPDEVRGFSVFPR